MPPSPTVAAGDFSPLIDMIHVNGKDVANEKRLVTLPLVL